jgi:hypothetical protein
MTDIDALANLKATLAGADPADPEFPAPPAGNHGPDGDEGPAGITAPAALDPTAPVEQEAEKIFQHYSSSRVSTCLVTTAGVRINFTNYEYYTKNPDIIEYLNEAIAVGLRGITKGEMVSKDELSPMAALKRKHIAEFLASQKGRDYGDTKDKSQRTKTLTTDQVAN